MGRKSATSSGVCPVCQKSFSRLSKHFSDSSCSAIMTDRTIVLSDIRKVSSVQKSDKKKKPTSSSSSIERGNDKQIPLLKYNFIGSIDPINEGILDFDDIDDNDHVENESYRIKKKSRKSHSSTTSRNIHEDSNPTIMDVCNVDHIDHHLLKRKNNNENSDESSVDNDHDDDDCKDYNDDDSLTQKKNLLLKMRLFHLLVIEIYHQELNKDSELLEIMILIQTMKPIMKCYQMHSVNYH